MSVKIRQATIADAELLSEIARQSFNEAFADNPKNHPEDMKAYMDEAFSLETISSELVEKDTIYLIAEFENEVAGYAKIRLNSREDCISEGTAIELCRLYALEKFIGKGVGKSLMQTLFKISEENEFDIVWLGVWEFNYRAQDFYKKWGFEKVGEHVFQLGNDPQIDWVMERKV